MEKLILSWVANLGDPLFRLDNSGVLYINKSTVKKLPKSKREIINKYDVWISQKTENNKSFYRFENHQSLPLSEWFVDIKPTILGDVFVVWTKNRKFGIVKINN